MDYQKIILVGNASDDPKVRKSKKGDITFTTLSVAVSEGKERTLFFPIAVFGKLGEIVAEHIKKGRQILVEGRIEISHKSRFNVVADRIRFGIKPSKPETTKKKKSKAKTSGKRRKQR